MLKFALSYLFVSITMTFIIVAISALNRLIGGALPAKLRYAVWVAVLIGAVIPLRPTAGKAIVTIPLPVSISGRLSPMHDDIPISSESGILPAIEIAPVVIFIIIWAIIAIIILIYHIRRYACFIKMVQRWGITVRDENILSVLRAVQTEMGLEGKRIELKVCGFISSSMMTGFRKVKILLPEKNYEADELDLIFRHELIHYKRCDLFVKLASIVAIAIHWYNPAIYKMIAEIQAESEASCDEAVLFNADDETRRFYAEVIVGMSGDRKYANVILSTCFYGGKASIKKRLDSIMGSSRKVKRTTTAFIFACVLTAMAFSSYVFAFALQDTPEIIGMVATENADESNIEILDNMLTYEIKCRYDNRQYIIVIDSSTGKVISFKEDETTPFISYDEYKISFEKAIEIAIENVGGGFVEEVEFEYEKGLWQYEVNVIFNDREKEVYINADTGEITKIK